MSRILLLLWTLLAMPAHAADVSFLVLPSFAGSMAQAYGATANVLICGRYTALHTITGATRLVGGVTNFTTPNSHIGFAIYADTDSVASPTVVARFDTDATASGALVGSVSSFNLVAGTVYRGCTCSTSIVTQAYGGIPSVPATGAGSWMGLANAFSNSVGTADSYPCTAGVPPDRTGALTASTTWSPPLLLAEIL